jgi:hypothetical protein
MANPFNLAIISSGDPEEDAREIAFANRTEGNVREGLCPNGCARLEYSKDPKLEGLTECLVCGCVTNHKPLEKQ